MSPGLLHFKQPAISQAAFDNLKEVKNRLPLEDNTLIIARHGLEWWAGWALHCKTGNEKEVDSETPGQNRQVLFLHQKKGMERQVPEGNLHGFREPQPPFGELVEVLDTEFFRAYRWED